MTETPLSTQKRKETTGSYANLTKRIEAVDRNIETETDGERLETLRVKRADLARQREDAATELSRLGWNVGDDTRTPEPIAGRDAHDYAYGERMADEIRQNDKQLDRLDARLAILSDEVARIRQDLAVTKVTTDGIRNDLKEKIEALSAELYRMRGDLAITKEAVLAVQNELRRMADKISAPPRGLSNNGIIAILVTGLLVIVLFVALTVYSLMRPI